MQRYLDLDVITDMPSFKARKSDINAWVWEFGNTRRDEIKSPAVNKAMAKWEGRGDCCEHPAASLDGVK